MGQDWAGWDRTGTSGQKGKGTIGTVRTRKAGPGRDGMGKDKTEGDGMGLHPHSNGAKGMGS